MSVRFSSFSCSSMNSICCSRLANKDHSSCCSPSMQPFQPFSAKLGSKSSFTRFLRGCALQKKWMAGTETRTGGRVWRRNLMPACNFLPMYQGERSASALRKLQSMARPSTIWRRKSSDKEGASQVPPPPPSTHGRPRAGGGRAHTRRWWLRLLCAAPPCGLCRHRPHPPSAGRLHRHPTRSRRPAHQPVSRAVSWARQAFSGCHLSRADLGPGIPARSGLQAGLGGIKYIPHNPLSELHLSTMGREDAQHSQRICGPGEQARAVHSFLNMLYIRIRYSSSCSHMHKNDIKCLHIPYTYEMNIY